MSAQIDVAICAQHVLAAALKAQGILDHALGQHAGGDWVKMEAIQAKSAHEAMERADELVRQLSASYADDDQSQAAVLMRRAGNILTYCLATINPYPQGDRGHESHLGRSRSAISQLGLLAREAKAFLDQHQGEVA